MQNETYHRRALISVIMPAFQGAAFIARALGSLQAQKLTAWELLIVDDGSSDETRAVIHPFLGDTRIRYHALPRNVGLGAALNVGLDLTTASLIAYLPVDDVLYSDHLDSLATHLGEHPEAVLTYSGVRHHYNREATGVIEGYPLQLVQVLHRRVDERWVERPQLVTDDLERMYWSRLRAHGVVLGTNQVTCEWVDHPSQRHKVIREPEGGINPYRVRYRVPEPLRFHSSVGNYIDEVARYRHFRERPAHPPAPTGLKILLAGELAYNAERVLALEERGHRLYGLWTDAPYWYNTVGPLPFGHVQDLPRDSWREALARLQPDVIYAGLNWQAVPFALEVMRAAGSTPFVWHFKEGPFICLEGGTWSALAELYRRAAGRIYVSPEMQHWFHTVLPDLIGSAPELILDGDLPKRDWLEGEPSALLSARDGELHTVVPGRPIGLTPELVGALAGAGIHLHFYGDFTQGQWVGWIERTRKLAPRHLHLHANVDQEQWVPEFSAYDAGWLHFFRSENAGEIRRANWDDLNIPARMATLAAAGLPMIQGRNDGAIVATERLARDLDIGLFFHDIPELDVQLRDASRMAELRANVWRTRDHFTFDHHADRLIAFFREVIATRSKSHVAGADAGHTVKSVDRYRGR